MHDIPILNYVGSVHAVTVHQLLELFYWQRGIAVSSGYRLVSELQRAGLIDVTSLHPHLGRRSRSVVTLTDAGRRIADPSWLRHVNRRSANVSERLMHQLQYAEMCLVRESEGWERVPGRGAWIALQEWAKCAFGVGRLTETEECFREFFRRPRDVSTPCELLLKRDHSELRFVVAGVSGSGVDKILAAMPMDTIKVMRGVETLPGRSIPIRFEVVATSDRQATKVSNAVRRWCKRYRLGAVQSFTVPSFLHRQNPRSKPRLAASFYAAAGLPDPWIVYYTPTRWRRFVDT